MKKIIGAILVSIPLVVVITFSVLKIGFASTVFILGGVLLLYTMFGIGLYLLGLLGD